MAEILRVREAFAYDVGGATVVASPGKLFLDSDPAVKGRERFFEPAVAVIDRESSRTDHKFTETASAAPGEERALTSPRRRAKAVASTESESE